MRLDETKGLLVPTRDEVEYVKQAFVREGRVTLRTLGRKGVVRSIPEGECAIGALCRDSLGRIFGMTSGRSAHIFVYDASPWGDYVVDLGVIGEGRHDFGALAAGDDGVVYAGTRPQNGQGRLFRYVSEETDFVGEFGYSLSGVEDLGVPVTGEGIASLSFARVGSVLFGLSDQSGMLFAFHASDASLEVLGRPEARQGKPAFLISTGNGLLHLLGEEGTVVQYVRDNGAFVALGRADLSPGERITAAVSADTEGGIFVATSQGNVLRWRSGRFRNIGHAPRNYGVRAMTMGANGELHGVAGRRGGMCHLFVSTAHGPVRDLGKPFAMVERYWHGYEFDAMATGQFGEIYLGESDRISHLFIYHPPANRTPL